VFGSERLIGALLDRLTLHVYILELNGGSFWLAHSTTARKTIRPIVLGKTPLKGWRFSPQFSRRAGTSNRIASQHSNRA
jgi:hypothetical protein